MEPGNIAQWVALAVSLATALYQALSLRSKAAADKVAALERKVDDKASVGRISALEDRVDKVEDRTTAIEGELRHLPSRDQTHSMEIALQEMKGALAVLTEKLNPIASTNQRLQEFLLEEARSKREPV